MDGPENEEYDEQMMGEPKTLMVLLLESLKRGDKYHHQNDEHDVPRPSWASSEVCENESFEALMILGGQLCEIVPMGNGVDPGEENDRISYQLVE